MIVVLNYLTMKSRAVARIFFRGGPCNFKLNYDDPDVGRSWILDNGWEVCICIIVVGPDGNRGPDDHLNEMK